MSRTDQQWIEKVDSVFNDRRKEFIEFMNNLENKPIPDLASLPDSELQQLYGECVRSLTNKLMWIRNRPITGDYLNALKNSPVLPKSIKIILDSI